MFREKVITLKKETMITNKINLMTIYDYAKLSNSEKMNLIKGTALFIDQYNSDHITYVYFLNGFFVEVTEKAGQIVDIIPYKRGYCKNKATGEKVYADKLIG